MNSFFYSVALQWRLDIRSKSLLVTCYIVPLIFFLLMGGIFTSVMPEMGNTLIQSMIVMSVSMGAFIGFPPSLIETYGSDIKKIYKANGAPIYLGLVTMYLSAFVHLMISCLAIVLLAPILFTDSTSFFLSWAFCIYYCIVERRKHTGAYCKNPGKADHDSTTRVFTLNYAFGDYVSNPFTARFSCRFREVFSRLLGISFDVESRFSS